MLSDGHPRQEGSGGVGALPSASVIVPVRDGLPELRRCVRALLEQDYPAHLVEVVVADNGSAVWPGDMLPAHPRLRLLSEPTPGSYRARNAALAASRGEVVAFTDADCLPRPDWLRSAVTALDADPPADAVGGAVELRFAGGEPRTGPEWYEFLHAFPQREYVDRGFAVTANLVTRRAVIERLGAFDATLASGGDAEWCRRIGATGGRLRYAPLARVEHPARATRRDLVTKARRTTDGVATKALRRPGGRRSLSRMLVGQARGAVVRSFTVWRAPAPDTALAAARYLGTSWAVSAAVAGRLIRALLRPGPA